MGVTQRVARIRLRELSPISINCLAMVCNFVLYCFCALWVWPRMEYGVFSWSSV